MRQIGVRELRQNASQYLRQVEAGERFEVTVHGRPVAWLTPRPMTRREQFIAEGRLRPAKRDPRELKLPLFPAAAPGEPTLSEILEQMRAEDRERG